MTVASLVFSAVALGVSCLALGWQMLSWFMNGGRMKVDVRFVGDGPPYESVTELPHGGDDTYLEDIEHYGGVAVRVVNKGRLPIYVASAGITFDRQNTLLNPDWSRGPELPAKVEPGQDMSWVLLNPAVRTFAERQNLPDDAPVWGAVRLSTGRYLNTKKKWPVWYRRTKGIIHPMARKT